MVSAEKGLPESFAPGTKRSGDGTIDLSTAANVKWGVKIGDAFYGTPSVAGGKVFVGGLDGQDGIFVCFDAATGTATLAVAGPAARGAGHDRRLFDRPGHHPAPDRRLLVGRRRWGPRLFRLQPLRPGVPGCRRSAAGAEAGKARVVWTYDMWEQLGVFPCDAANGSPLIVGDLLYVPTCNGVDRNTFGLPAKEKNRKIPAPDAPNLIVVDKRDGRLVATDDAPIVPGAAARAVVFAFAGQGGRSHARVLRGRRRSLLCLRGAGVGPREARAAEDRLVVRLHPAGIQGDRRRRLDHPLLPGRQAGQGTLNKHDGTFVGRSEIIATPVFVNDRVYVAIGRDPAHGRGRGALHCIDARGRGDITASGRIWTYQGLDRTLSTVSVADGLVYVSDVGGRLHCLDAETGQCYWIHDTKCETWGSTLVADGKVYMPTAKGLWVLAAGKELKVLGRITLGGKVYASPVAAHGTLYVATTHGWLWAACKQ